MNQLSKEEFLRNLSEKLDQSNKYQRVVDAAPEMLKILEKVCECAEAEHGGEALNILTDIISELKPQELLTRDIGEDNE